MTRIIPIRQGIALRELMCGKHEKPVTREKLIDEAVRRVSNRIGERSVLPAARHRELWLDAPRIIPLVSICHEYRSLAQ